MTLFVTTRLNTAIALHASGELPYLCCRLKDGAKVEFIFRDDAGIGSQREAEYESGRALPVNAIFASQRWLRKLMTNQQNAAQPNRAIGAQNDRSIHATSR